MIEFGSNKGYKIVHDFGNGYALAIPPNSPTCPCSGAIIEVEKKKTPPPKKTPAKGGTSKK
jgi:hypothetical protein